MTAERVRFAGVIVAVLFAAYGILRYRRGGWSRFGLFLSLLVASGVAVVSVLPQVGEIFTRLFGLENRGFALLSFATLLLFGLFLYLLNQVQEARHRNGEIVTGLAVRQYAEQYLSPEEQLSDKREILIVVPAYNEEGGIREVLRKMPEKLPGYEVKTVVVDDGSTDATEAITLKEDFPVVTHVVNRGQGDALRTGFAIAQLERAEIVVNLDADGQYRPEEIGRLAKPIIEDEVDFRSEERRVGKECRSR